MRKRRQQKWTVESKNNDLVECNTEQLMLALLIRAVLTGRERHQMKVQSQRVRWGGAEACAPNDSIRILAWSASWDRRAYVGVLTLGSSHRTGRFGSQAVPIWRW